MLYESAQEWREASSRRIMLFGMSGLGKTHISNLLRAEGGWFHYSVDYRIGTRYMGEHIADNFKREAMKVPPLRVILSGARGTFTDMKISSAIRPDRSARSSTRMIRSIRSCRPCTKIC